MRCKYPRDVDAGDQCDPALVTVKNGRRVIAAGTIVDAAVHALSRPAVDVRAGIAVPDDDECREACGMTPQQIAAAQKVIQKWYTPPTEEAEEDDDE